MKTSDIEFTAIPIPSKKRNTPVNIGFLTYRYGPVFTTMGGGLIGTGVPLTLTKWKADQAVTKIPDVMISKDRGILS